MTLHRDPDGVMPGRPIVAGTSRAFSEPPPLFLCGKELAGSCPKATSPGQPDWTQTRGFGRRSAPPPCGQVHGGPGSALTEGRERDGGWEPNGRDR